MLDLKETEKGKHIGEMVGLLASAGKIPNSKVKIIIKKIIEREKKGSTGIGEGVGIPHVKIKDVDNIVGALGVSKKGINFNSLDGHPVYISFLLLTPDEDSKEHLQALSAIAQFLKDSYYRDELRAVKNKKQVQELIKKI